LLLIASDWDLLAAELADEEHAKREGREQ